MSEESFISSTLQHHHHDHYTTTIYHEEGFHRIRLIKSTFSFFASTCSRGTLTLCQNSVAGGTQFARPPTDMSIAHKKEIHHHHPTTNITTTTTTTHCHTTFHDQDTKTHTDTHITHRYTHHTHLHQDVPMQSHQSLKDSTSVSRYQYGRPSAASLLPAHRQRPARLHPPRQEGEGGGEPLDDRQTAQEARVGGQ